MKGKYPEMLRKALRFFTLIRSARSSSPANENPPLHTDLHSHLIPAIDDGVKSLDESLLLIKELYHLGYTKIITTPHIMSDSYRNNPVNILSGLEKVKSAVKNAGIPVVIEAAAEYYLDEHFEKLLDNGEILTFGAQYLLFEMSFVMRPSAMEGMVFKMISSGYKPVLAHPERYPYLYDNKLRQYRDLKQLGILFQLNLSSLTTAYSDLVRNVAHKLIDNQMIDFAGSDLHNERQMKYLKSSLREKYFQKLLSLPLLNHAL